MNKKGFTAIEILLSFVLVMFITINIFSIINHYKQNSQLSFQRSELTNMKNIVVKDIYNDVLTYGLKEITSCGSNCLNLIFNDNSVRILRINNVQTAAGVRDKYIEYNNLIYQIKEHFPDPLPSGANILNYQSIKIDTGDLYKQISTGTEEKVYKLKIGIEHVDLKENFDIVIITTPNASRGTSDGFKIVESKTSFTNDLGTLYNGEWTKESVTLSISTNDIPGSRFKELEYSTNDGATWQKTTSKTINFTTDINTDVLYRAVSQTNYKTDVRTAPVRIDLTGPTIPELEYGIINNVDPNFNGGLNDIAVYNNSANNYVTHQRIAQTTPYGNYIIRINTSAITTPGFGGFVQSTQSTPNGVYIHKFAAKIPKGYQANHASNATGTGSSVTWLTSREGTGDWAEYIYIHRAGSTGTFSNLGHVYLTGPGPSVTWDIAYATVFLKVFNYGTLLFSDPNFASGSNSMIVYNNTGNGNVTHTRVALANPYGSYAIRIITNGTASPAHGGFIQVTESAGRENKFMIHKFFANIPVGYSVMDASNPTGTGSYKTWLSSTAGTGQYQEYMYMRKIGQGGTLSNFGHVYLLGGSAPVTWDVIWSTMYEGTKEVNLPAIITKGSDTGSGIAFCGYSTSATVEPTTYYNVSNHCTLPGVQVGGKYYVWFKDKVGNTVNREVTIFI